MRLDVLLRYTCLHRFNIQLGISLVARFCCFVAVLCEFVSVLNFMGTIVLWVQLSLGIVKDVAFWTHS